MSGPLRRGDDEFANGPCPAIESRQGRAVRLGGVDIVRVLPTKGRRTVGPWCFVDLILPIDAEHPDPMEIGPHPHIGLSTVTWLFSGEAEHSDSLGTLQLIRAGELNLMSAGHGIAHAELGSGRNLRGAQMWLAQPEATRHAQSSFQHHQDLPVADLTSAEATVIVGDVGGATSPATADWPTLGCELRLRRGTVEVPVITTHEHAVVPVDQPVLVGDVIVEPGWLGLVPAGQEAIRIETRAEATQVMLIGGEPLPEPIQMWWNFVARTKDEITDAWRAWEAHDTDRFGPVPSSLARIAAPRPPWLPSAE